MSAGSSHSSAHYGDRDAVRAVVVSAVALGFAALLEIVAAMLSRSASILADGLHNSGDVLTTFILLFTFALVRRPATRRYSSGYGRFEDVATLLIIIVITITAALAVAASFDKLLHPPSYANIAYGLAAALVGIIANLGVAEYKVRVGRVMRSEALEADGVHSRIDALVSAGAFAGIGLAGLGFTIADPIVGLGISAAIVYILGGTVRQLYYRMMDAVDPTMLDEIANAAKSVDGVLGVHDVRARWVGRQLVATLHIDCDPDASLSAAHHVAVHVEEAICREVPAARVEIHMDPGTEEHRHEVVGRATDRNDDHQHK